MHGAREVRAGKAASPPCHFAQMASFGAQGTVRNGAGLRFRVLSSFLSARRGWPERGWWVAGEELGGWWVAGGQLQENGGVAGVAGLVHIWYGVSLPNRTETPQYRQYIYR